MTHDLGQNVSRDHFEGRIVPQSERNDDIGHGGSGRSASVLWYALGYLIHHADSLVLDQLASDLQRTGTHSRVLGMIDDEIGNREFPERS